MNGALLDTGFLVSLFRRSDRLRERARQWLRENRAPLHSLTPVIVETSFFLAADEKIRLLEWIERGALEVHETPAAAFPAIASIVRKYADRDIDFADAGLIWLAGLTGIRTILTVDDADFSIYRLKGGRRFELGVWLD